MLLESQQQRRLLGSAPFQLRLHFKSCGQLTSSRPDPAAPRCHNSAWSRESGRLRCRRAQWTKQGMVQIRSCLSQRPGNDHTWLRERVCVLYARTCWNCIRSNATWNYWHVGWGLEILWQKDFKCHGICFHRIWLFFWGKHHSKAKTV